ncbi:phage holin family protein [Enterococcus asini]|uniref:phage holin family protein n=1 Tax=Enterococcus asini TaxID=57732 RepID=UPI001E533E82|nr:phage holin family protein [Enterococcus asini]MCD5029243.1 phage holin family protein [Enterococcus asini]
MEKYFNSISMFVGLAGGIVAGLLGGIDTIMHALIFLMIVDYITGLAKGAKNKELNSEIGFVGLLKKAMILVVVMVAVELERMTSNAMPIREIVIMFYVANEGISLLENISEFLPLPEKLKDYFTQIRDTGESGSENVDKNDQENNQ